MTSSWSRSHEVIQRVALDRTYEIHISKKSSKNFISERFIDRQNCFDNLHEKMKIDLQQLRTLPRDQFYVLLNGKIIHDWDVLKKSDDFHICLRVFGGKGGFGSLLKSFGSQFYKSTNQDMCRDLTGRRLKDVKEEERLKKYISKAADREREKQKNLELKYKKLKQRDERKHEFNDIEYTRTTQRILDETEDAVAAGLKVLEENEDPPSTSAETAKKPRIGEKREREETTRSSSEEEPLPKVKKLARMKGLWLGIDGFNESDLDSDAESTEESNDEKPSLNEDKTGESKSSDEQSTEETKTVTVGEKI